MFGSQCGELGHHPRGCHERPLAIVSAPVGSMGDSSSIVIMIIMINVLRSLLLLLLLFMFCKLWAVVPESGPLKTLI